MQLRITAATAVQMFNAWATFLEGHPGIRVLEDGSVKLDTAPQATPFVPNMDGSTIIAWYKSDPNAVTSERAIAEARMATQELGLPRSLFVGKLIDIKRGANGVYMKCRTITRQTADGKPAYRTFNPAKGTIIELLINPAPGDLSAAMTGHTPEA